MNLFSKIILTFLSLFIFLFIIFFTFIINSFSKFEKPQYIENKPGIFELKKSENNKYVLKKDILNNTGSTILKRINISDEIIYSSSSNEPILEKNTITIDKGIYFFNLRGLNNNYIIKGKGFEIKDLGVGIFIINTLNPKQNIIFSISSILNLDFINTVNDEYLSSIDLFPNIYLIFNPLENIYIKNSDLLKISQIFNLNFLSNKVVENNIISNKFLDLVSLKNDESKKVIINSMEFINSEYTKNELLLNNFINSDIGYFPSENFIEKYFLLFINNNKKNIYYKNIILRDFHKSISNNKDNFSSIIENYENLKSINPQSAKEIKEIMISLYNNAVKSNININTQLNISKIINKITNSKYNYSKKYVLQLEKSFFEYNFFKKEYFFNSIVDFKNSYFEKIEKLDKTKNIEIHKKLGYFLYFIEKILLSNYSSSISYNIDKIIPIFNNYVELSNYYHKNSNDKIKKTGLLTNSKILNNFRKNMKKDYFKKDRNENGLLILNENINTSDLYIFEKNIQKLLKFYSDNKKLLNPEMNNNDKFLIKHYSILSKNFNEYFSALKNYNEYIIEYDKNKLNLLSTNTINEGKIDNSLSEDKIYSYLKSFNGIGMKQVSIKIMDYSYCANPNKEYENIKVVTPYCYKIDKLLIPGESGLRNISFLLHPFQSNKMDEIIIDKEVKKGSYKLDEMQAILEKKGEESDDENKYEYSFANFFLNTFGVKSIETKGDNNVKENTNTNKINNEDITVKVFKRIKLLGEKGEFINLNGFINIKYNQLIVKQIENGFSIKINESEIKAKSSKGEIFNGIISSDYNFNIEPIHSFINPKLKLIDQKTGNFLLFGNSIYIKGTYDINLFEKELGNVLDYFGIIKYITYIVNTSFNTSDIDILFNKNSEEINFSLLYLNNPIEIKFYKGNITSVIYKNKNYITNKVPYKNLSNILNNITK